MTPEELYKKNNIVFKNAGDYKKVNILTVEKESAEFLYYVVKMIRPEIVVETGTGLSTILMASALLENKSGHLYSFDIDLKAMERLNGYDLNTNILKNVSVFIEPAKKLDLDKIDLLFLDADHSYEAVKKELEIFREYLVPGSYVAFHDSMHEKFVNKVGRAIKEFRAGNETEGINFKTMFGLTILRML